jgi:L-asparaginase
MNDRLTSVYYSTKTNANTPDTFKDLEQGFLGNFLGGQPHYYFGASQPTGKHWFDTSNITDWPRSPSSTVIVSALHHLMKRG